MAIQNQPEVTILQEIDVSKYPWCDSAVLFSVKNGRGTLAHFGTDPYGNGRYACYSQLRLNGKPLVQGDYPVCQTCCGYLAAGYGLENISCPELEETVRRINSGFEDITTSAELMKPFLGLLEDDVYVLADIPHYPTDGEGNFFWRQKNGLSVKAASCDDYYIRGMLTAVGSFPVYLYPTQPHDRLSMEQVEYYRRLIDEGKPMPRAIAYHEQGFISALLDGHHRAAASAMAGVQLSCLTIIKCDGFIHYTNKDGSKFDEYLFSGLRVSTDEIPEFTKTKKECEEFDLQDCRIFSEENSFGEFSGKLWRYPTVEELSFLYALDIPGEDITDELFERWLSAPQSDDNFFRLKYSLIFLERTDSEKAFRLARRVVKAADGVPRAEEYEMLPQRLAFRVLLRDKSEQTEQLFIDYLVNHHPGDECFDIVSAYWN